MGYESRHDEAYRYCEARSDELICWRWHRSRNGGLRKYGGSRWPNAAHYLARRPRSQWRGIVAEMLRVLPCEEVTR